jgi:hypothetical protein
MSNMPDVHNSAHRYELNKEKLQNSEHISQENKEAIQRFVDKSFAAGLYYFSLKDILECKACDQDFALSTHGRYFKPEYQEIEERENGKIRVTRGVRLFKCDDCGKWSAYHDKWQEELSGSWN